MPSCAAKPRIYVSLLRCSLAFRDCACCDRSRLGLCGESGRGVVSRCLARGPFGRRKRGVALCCALSHRRRICACVSSNTRYVLLPIEGFACTRCIAMKVAERKSPVISQEVLVALAFAWSTGVAFPFVQRYSTAPQFTQPYVKRSVTVFGFLFCLIHVVVLTLPPSQMLHSRRC